MVKLQFGNPMLRQAGEIAAQILSARLFGKSFVAPCTLPLLDLLSAPVFLPSIDVNRGPDRMTKKLVERRPQFGNPAVFNNCIAQSFSELFTVTLKNPAFFDKMIQFSGNQPGSTGGS